MRIAYILGTESWGGLEMNQVRNALWMQERGHDVIVYGIESSKAQDFCTENDLPFQVIVKHKKYYDFKAGKQLAKLLSANKTEHAIIRDVRDMSVCAIAKRKAKNRFKLHYFMEMQLGVNKKNLLHTIRFRSFDTWSCPLHWLEEQVKSKTKMDRTKIVCIPSALATEQFKNAPSKAIAQELLHLPTNKTLIGLAGRFDPQKGQLMLLQAFSQLKEENLHLVFIGQATMNEGDAYVQEIEAYIDTNDLADKIHLLPFRNDTETFYAALDACVMGSKCETVGMVTLEAMATGTIVIGSNAGGTKEILQNGKLGYLFEPMNSDSLKDALIDFLNKKKNVSRYELQESIQKFDKDSVLSAVEARLQFTSKN